MQFKKYQHIEKLGSPSTEGILNGTVHIFTKLDGTNAGVYLNENGEVEVNSRTRVLKGHHDNAGVRTYVLSQKKFTDYLQKHPNHRLFGEWLVPHTIRNYTADAWQKLYIFDVIKEDAQGNQEYLTYDEYKPLLEEFGIEYIPCICTKINPSLQEVTGIQNECKYLMPDGAAGEGIVIKNYNFVNQFGKIVWAKVVRPIIGAAVKMHKPVNGEEIESCIVERFITPDFVEKEFAKIKHENDRHFEKADINKFLNLIWFTFITEEMFNVLRKFKNPKVDFALLRKLVIDRVKEIKAEIFQRQ